MTVTLRFWGTRGSIPTPGPRTVRYGGNTACVELRGPAGEILVFDAGTGLRELGSRLGEDGDGSVKLALFISHLHWDHIQGLPFFRPAYDPRTTIAIYGPSQPARPLRLLLGLGMDAPFFPVQLDGLPARVTVHEVDGEAVSVGTMLVRSAPLEHPAPCLAYRVDVDGKAVVYATDTEDPFLDRPNPVVTLADGADVLIHDAQYLDADRKPGWGHSTVEASIDVAIRANVRQLFLYHHDPERSDDALDRIAERAAAIVRERHADLRVTVARDGLELTL